MTSGRLSEKDGTPATVSLNCPAVLFNEIERRFCCILLHKFGSLSTLRNQLVDCSTCSNVAVLEVGAAVWGRRIGQICCWRRLWLRQQCSAIRFYFVPGGAILFLACAGEESNLLKEFELLEPGTWEMNQCS